MSDATHLGRVCIFVGRLNPTIMGGIREDAAVQISKALFTLASRTERIIYTGTLLLSLSLKQ